MPGLASQPVQPPTAAAAATATTATATAAASEAAAAGQSSGVVAERSAAAHEAAAGSRGTVCIDGFGDDVQVLSHQDYSYQDQANPNPSHFPLTQPLPLTRCCRPRRSRRSYPYVATMGTSTPTSSRYT